ncbi:hypothetical protein LJC68_02255 [Bacteroidales bacterium OttesenSCG-928-B11]|nr:hypothetical protein [Bacteroidales bacterium OttesenSCG-928-B11]MDL2325745.1 hypothetical protein [Bacteroidales bacterium OttesenSCG-928-A14]
MKTISESPITTLQIIKPDLIKKYYELKSGDELYGTVEVIDNSGTLARIETTQGVFTVKRAGFFRPYIIFRKEKHATDEIIAYLNIEGITKIILDNNAYYFRLVNLWKNQWGWTNEKNQIILRYKPTIAGFIKGDVEVSKDFTYLSFLETITVLGIYFLTQLEDEILMHNELTLQ